MASEEIKLSTPDQLDAMSLAHRAHAEAAQTAAGQISAGHGALQGLTNWGGDGFDDVSQFLGQFVGHMQAFGEIKQRMAAAVDQSKANYGAAESANSESMIAK